MLIIFSMINKIQILLLLPLLPDHRINHQIWLAIFSYRLLEIYPFPVAIIFIIILSLQVIIYPERLIDCHQNFVKSYLVTYR